jgi:hypothetical protein
LSGGAIARFTGDAAGLEIELGSAQRDFNMLVGIISIAIDNPSRHS